MPVVCTVGQLCGKEMSFVDKVEEMTMAITIAWRAMAIPNGNGNEQTYG